MRTRQVTEQHTVIRKTLDTTEVKCDLCGKVAPTPDEADSDWGGGVWAKGSYDVQDVVVRYKFGSSYPEGTFVDIAEFDICPDCFRDRLVPWLREQGAVGRVRDSDEYDARDSEKPLTDKELRKT
jgi:hypothetical protein